MSLDGLRNLIATVTGQNVIWSHPNAPRPASPYVLLNIVGDSKIGSSYKSRIDAEGEQDVCTTSEFVLSIQFFAGQNGNPTAAFTSAKAFRSQLEKATVREDLLDLGYGYVSEAGINDTPALVGTGFEARAVLDVTLRDNTTVVDDLGIVETVIGTGTVDSTTFPFEATIE